VKRSGSNIPVSAHPEGGEQRGCPDPPKHPLDPIAGEVVRLDKSNPVEGEYNERVSDPSFPCHGVRQRITHTSYQSGRICEAGADSMTKDDEAGSIFVLNPPGLSRPHGVTDRARERTDLIP
jgi:hypothetical protein